MKKALRSTVALLAFVLITTSTVIPVSAGAMALTPTTVYHVGDKTPVIDGVYSPDEGWGDPITTVTFDMTQKEGAYLSLCDAGHPELMSDKDLIPSKTDVYMRWDEKALYYCAVVVQEKRWNGVGGGDNGDIWKNDSIIFNITTTEDDDDKSRAGVGINNDGDIAYGTFATQGGTYGFDNFQDWKVTRNEETKTTTYEIPFLWEEIMEDEKAPVENGLKLRDLLMPTYAEDQVNPVDFNLSGIENGKYKYWDITLSENTAGEEVAGKTVTIPRIAEMGVNIDGERDALYDLCAPQAMTEQNLDYFSGSLEDSTGTFWALYNSSYIYLYVDIADEDIDYSNGNPQETWNRESIGVMFDFSYNRTPQYEYNYANNGDKVCYINLSGDGVIVTYHMYAKEANNGLFDQIEYKTVSPESGSGHILYEIACPIPEEIDIEEGGKFGLEVIATEALGGSRLGCVSWSEAGSEMWHYSDVLGTAFWGGKDGGATSSGTLTEIQAFDYKECGDNTNEELQYSHEDPDIKTALSLKPLDGVDPVGTWYDFDVTVEAGDVEFTFLYAAKDDRYMDVTFNNETKQVTCSNTGNFQTFDKVSVIFSGVQAGTQTLRIGAPSDYSDTHKTPNIDVIWYGAPGAAPAAQTTSETELLAKSWDTIFVDFEMMVDGGAGAWLAENPIEGDIGDFELRGWAHLATPIPAFAYTIDGGDPVQSEDFIQDRPDVKAAIHEEAEGFDIQIEVAGLGAGDHLIKIYAVDANGGLVDTGFDFPFTLTRDEAPAAPAGYPASGESGNFMMGKVIGNETGWDGTAASGAASAFDGKPETFFDPLGVGDGFCGMEYDEPYILEKVAILSRSTFLDRFAGASIEGSNDGEEWETLWESDDVAPSATEYNIVTEFENNYGYKMFRYINWINHGDVAEVEFYGKPGTAERPAEEPKAEKPVKTEEPAPAEEPKTEEPAPAEEPKNEEPAQTTPETPTSTETPTEKKSGCGAFIGGGLVVLVAVLGSAWISKRR